MMTACVPVRVSVTVCVSIGIDGPLMIGVFECVSVFRGDLVCRFDRRTFIHSHIIN